MNPAPERRSRNDDIFPKEQINTTMIKLENDKFYNSKFIGNQLNIAACTTNKNPTLRSSFKMVSLLAARIISEQCNKNDYLEFRNFYKNYLNANFLLKSVKLKQYIKSQTFPITLLRALTLYLKDSNVTEELFTNCVVNYKGQVIRFPLDKNNLLDPKLAYLAGVIYGDGYLNEEQVRIYDGHYKKELLHFSKQFIDYVGNIFQEIFISTPINIKQRGNMFELIIVCELPAAEAAGVFVIN
ncbi:MAG: hypothetical protein ABID38_00815 [Candidatus Diapherotrites archaeon]